MSSSQPTPLEEWLNVSQTERPDVWRMDFCEHHLGNPLIRSIHGGAVGTMIEYCAEAGLRGHLADNAIAAAISLTTSSIEYLRVTKDAALFGRYQPVRIGRRVAFVDVWCWQDSEELMVARGACTLRIL